MSIKNFVSAFLWFAVMLVSSSSRADLAAVLHINDKQKLLQAAGDTESRTVMRRACEIQKAKGWPPVSCFAFVTSEAEALELTDECRRLAPRAPVLPALNPHVTKVCRKAIETRRLDLKYVTNGIRSDAFRQASDALR
jgi:hypothetical protein